MFALCLRLGCVFSLVSCLVKTRIHLIKNVSKSRASIPFLSTKRRHAAAFSVRLMGCFSVRARHIAENFLVGDCGIGVQLVNHRNAGREIELQDFFLAQSVENHNQRPE